MPPSTTWEQHLCGKLQKKSVNEYNTDCSFESNPGHEVHNIYDYLPSKWACSTTLNWLRLLLFKFLNIGKCHIGTTALIYMISYHHFTSANFSNPSTWPCCLSYCIFLANLRFPSIMNAACLGIWPAFSTLQHRVQNQLLVIELLSSSSDITPFLATNKVSFNKRKCMIHLWDKQFRKCKFLPLALACWFST